MRTLKTYEVYNHFGELIVSGTASKCAECLGMNDHHFRNVANLAEAGGYKNTGSSTQHRKLRRLLTVAQKSLKKSGMISWTLFANGSASRSISPAWVVADDE